MRVLIADTFTKSLSRLDAPVQSAVKRAAFDFQAQPAGLGPRLHRLAHSMDRDFWSLRVNRDVRIIIHRSGDEAVLCYADHHEGAYAWAEQRKVAPAAGAACAAVIEVAERRASLPAPAGVAVLAEARGARMAPAPEGGPQGERPASRRRLRLRQRAAAPLCEPAAGRPVTGDGAPLLQLLRAARRRPGGSAGSAGQAPPPQPDALTLCLHASAGRRPRPLWPKLAAIPLAAALGAGALGLAAGSSGWRQLALAAGVAAALAAAAGAALVGRAVRRALAELRRLAEAVRAGRLDTRAVEAAVEPELEPVLLTVNQIVAAFALPLARTTLALAGLARGELPDGLAEPLGGEFDRQREAILALTAFLRLGSEDIRRLVDGAGGVEASGG